MRRDLPEITQLGSGVAGPWSHVCQTRPPHAAISVPFWLWFPTAIALTQQSEALVVE